MNKIILRSGVAILTVLILVKILLTKHNGMSSNVVKIIRIRSDESYYWCNDNKLILILNDYNENVQAKMLCGAPIVCLDCIGITKVINKLGRKVHRYLSPDGKWLLIVPWKQQDLYYLISVETGLVEVRHMRGTFVSWQPNSKEWIICGDKGDNHWYRCSIVNTRVIRLAIQPNNLGNFIGCLEDGSYYVADWGPTRPGMVHFLKISAESGAILQSTYICAPPNSRVQSLSIASNGKLLLWECQDDSSKGLFRKLTGLFAPESNSIWTSTLNGGKFTNVFSAQSEYINNQYACLSGARLLPNGHSISFEYGGMLNLINN